MSKLGSILQNGRKSINAGQGIDFRFQSTPEELPICGRDRYYEAYPYQSGKNSSNGQIDLLRKSFEAADRVARHIVILGEDEVRDGVATVKSFATGEQRKVGQEELASLLRD